MRFGVIFLVGAAFCAWAAPPQFESAVAPIFQANCVPCHGTRVKMKDLDLSSLDAVMRGSESGPVLTPGKPAESRLLQMVREGKMPMGKPRLADKDIAAIETWIAAGAPSLSHVAKAEGIGLNDVLPTLLLRCAICHGLRRQEGGLDLHDYAAIRKGGKSGPVLIPGQPGASLLLKRIQAGEMPPKKGLLDAGVKPVTAGEIEKLSKWIAAGAADAPRQSETAAGPDPLVSERIASSGLFRRPGPRRSRRFGTRTGCGTRWTRFC